MNRIWTNRGCMDLLYMYWVYILYMYRLQTWDVIWALIFMHTNEMDGSFSGDSVVCNYARTTVLYREGARSLLFEQNRSNIHACHGDQSRVAREQYIPLCRTPFIQYATSNKMLQSLLLLWIWHVDDSICVVIEHTLIRCMQFSLISMCHSCQVCKMVFFFFCFYFLHPLNSHCMRGVCCRLVILRHAFHLFPTYAPQCTCTYIYSTPQHPSGIAIEIQLLIWTNTVVGIRKHKKSGWEQNKHGAAADKWC